MEAPSPVGVTPNRRLMILAIACLLAAYVGAYVCMSRRGYAEADRWDGAGFYYFTPENSDSWRRWNYGCEILFRPLNWIDRQLGCGRPPAYEPMWGIN